jgi:hypothetical protein
MPQQRKVVVIYDKSPRHETELPPMEIPLAEEVKRKLDHTKGGKVFDVKLRDVPDGEK